MKTRFSVVLSVSLIAASTLLGGDTKPGLVVHEWGTFTSLQGSDGVPLRWGSLDTASLPNFVYNWQRPGFERQANSPYFAGIYSKGAVTSLQRMETPVIYFYSDRERSVDVSVGFPQGLVTEWYPQAEKIGPSIAPPSSTVMKIDHYMAKMDVPTNYLASAIVGTPSVKESVINWTGVRVIPARTGQKPAPLRTDSGGSHYYSARDTDAAELLVETSSKTNQTSEREKFLFYRGIGDFATPLVVRMNTDNAVTMINNSGEPLQHLFVLTVSNGAGRIVHVESLAANSEQTVLIAGQEYQMPAGQLSQRISTEMAAALVSQGLYPREAAAMVATWKTSWFAEEGTRVLYILPRAWTDKTLPMKLSPSPTELVRVMVGRAEVLSPAVEHELTASGPVPTGASIDAIKRLGRFGNAAFQHALAAKAHP